MKSLTLAAALAAAALIPASAGAQQVSAVIVIGRPPVVVERSYPRYHDYSYYRAPRRVIIERRSPRVIYVTRVRGHHKHHHSRPVHAWYDYRRDAYYDGYRDGLREVVLYQNDDRYYRYDDDYDRYDD